MKQGRLFQAGKCEAIRWAEARGMWVCVERGKFKRQAAAIRQQRTRFLAKGVSPTPLPRKSPESLSSWAGSTGERASTAAEHCANANCYHSYSWHLALKPGAIQRVPRWQNANIRRQDRPVTNFYQFNHLTILCTQMELAR